MDGCFSPRNLGRLAVLVEWTRAGLNPSVPLLSRGEGDKFDAENSFRL